MCGIAGLLNRNGKPADVALVGRMTDTLRHRGPDDRGIWVDGAVGLGHTRLAIRDLSPAGHQPMADARNRIFVTYNGEIYNDQEIRRDLERDFGVRFRTKCDTELIPYGYLAWGEELFERLEGMFAIGLWDAEKRLLVLARDPIGIKPVFFLASRELVVFGSELKALLVHPAVSCRLDKLSLHTFLAAGHVGARRSLVEGVEQVPPGVVVRFSGATQQSRSFWQPRRRGTREGLDAALECLAPLVEETVHKTLVSDVPLGVLQSGGIDSSIVSLSIGSRSSVPLFTAGSSEASHDETAGAREIARLLGQPHHVLPIEDDPDPVGTFEAMVRHFDGQCADTGAYGFYRLCGEVRKHAKVALTGDGGDEFFGGYSTYSASRHARWMGRLVPRAAAELVARTAYIAAARDERRLGGAEILYRFAAGLAAGGPNAHVHWRRLVPRFWLEKLYGSGLADLRQENPFWEYETYLDQPEDSFIERCMIADQRFHLQSILTKVDAMSMAHGLEIRVPLLERKVMDFAGTCGIDLLLPSGGPEKLLLRELAKKLGAPRSVTQGPKRGFNVPNARMLRTSLASLGKRQLESEADKFAPFFRPDTVRKLWRDHFEQRANNSFGLWPILTLGVWLDQLGTSEATE